MRFPGSAIRFRAHSTLLTVAVLLSFAPQLRAETWYWVGLTPTEDAKGSLTYQYTTAANWTNSTGAAGVPQTGDTAVLGSTSGGNTPYAFSTTSTDGRYALECILYPGPYAQSINQGNFKLQTGGRGLQYLVNRDSGSNWSGIVLVGDGEGIVNVSNKVDLSMQMRIHKAIAGSTPILVKEGLGRLICFNQNRADYTVPLTKIRRGTLNVTPNGALSSGLEFRFDSAAADARLEIGNPGKYDLILPNGLVSESAEAVGSDHGFTSPNGCAIRFTGTPGANPMVFTGKFYNGCGLGWAPDSETAEFVCSGATSTTTGAFEIAKGTFCLTNGATFTQLSSLRLGTNAVFKVAEGAGALFKVGRLTRTDATSVLKLGPGVELEALALVQPDGSELPRGIYGATSANGSIAVDWIEGDGFVGVGGAVVKHSPAAHLMDDGWYEFGDTNWTHAASTWFQNLPECDFRRFFFPAGSKVRLVGGLLIDSFIEEEVTLDASGCRGIGAMTPQALGTGDFVVPSGCRFWFRSPYAGAGNTLQGDLAMNGSWMINDTTLSMTHAGRFSGTGSLTLYNYWRTFTHTGSWAFKGTVDQQQVGNNVTLRPTAVSGTVAKWYIRGGNASSSATVLTYAPQVAAPLSIADFETQGSGGLAASGTRYGPAICVTSGNTINIAKLKTPANDVTKAMHLCANTTLSGAKPTSGRGIVNVGEVGSSYLYLYPALDLTVGTVTAATTFDCSSFTNVVNSGTFAVTGTCVADAKILANNPQQVPATVTGFGGTTELAGDTWKLVVDFDDLEGCRRTVGADWSYAASGTIEVTWINGAPQAGRYLLLEYPSGSAASDAARWPAHLASGRSSLLSLERTATGLYVVVGQGVSNASFYVDSENGDDAANGLTPQTAYRSLERINAADIWPGDRVFFRRGGLWRGTLTPKSGAEGRPVLYGTYGTGAKPIIQASVAAEAPGFWEATERPNVWRTVSTFAVDVGCVIFNHGEAAGWKVYLQAEVDASEPHRYLYDRTDRRVYLYSEGDPSTKWSSIELALKQHVVNEGSRHDVVYDGLWIRYGAAHGFGGGSVRRLVIRNCDICWIGGGVQEWNGDTPTRYGNGIEFWDNARDCVVEHNRLWEIYDAALTTQGHGDGIVESNIVYRFNTIWNAEYSFEMWTNPKQHTKPALCMDLYITNNTAYNAGVCWSHTQRPNGVNGSHLMFYGHSAPTTNFVIRNNVFCNATEWHSRISTKNNPMITIDHNVVWTDSPSSYCYYATNGYKIYTDFARYQTDLGWDATSTNARPLFVDAEARDFRLLPNSPGARMGPGGAPVGACPRVPASLVLEYR